MKKRIYFLLILLSLWLISAVTIFAKTDYITDFADLLTEQEEETLEKTCSQLAKQYFMDFVIVTADDMDGYSFKEYAKEFYKQNNYGYDEPNGDGFLLLIDMEDRKIHIMTKKGATHWILNSDISVKEKEIAAYLKDKNYYEGCKAYLKGVTTLLDEAGYDVEKEPPYPNKQTESTETESKFHLIALLGSLAISAGVTWILVKCFNGTDSNTSSSKDYIVGSCELLEKQDYYSHTVRTKTPKSQNNNDSGSNNNGGGDNNTGGGDGASF